MNPHKLPGQIPSLPSRDKQHEKPLETAGFFFHNFLQVEERAESQGFTPTKRELKAPESLTW